MHFKMEIIFFVEGGGGGDFMLHEKLIRFNLLKK